MPSVAFETKHLSLKPGGTGLHYAAVSRPAPKKLALITDLHGGTLPQQIFLQFCRQTGIDAIVSLGDDIPCWREHSPGPNAAIYRNFAAFANEDGARSFIGLRGNHHDLPEDCRQFYEPEIRSSLLPFPSIVLPGLPRPTAAPTRLPGLTSAPSAPGFIVVREYAAFVQQGNHVFVHEGASIAEVIERRCLNDLAPDRPLLVWHGHTHVASFSTGYVAHQKTNFDFDGDGYFKIFDLNRGQTYWLNLGVQAPTHVTEWDAPDWERAWALFAVFDDDKKQATVIRLDIPKDRVARAVGAGEALPAIASEFVKIPPHLRP